MRDRRGNEYTVVWQRLTGDRSYSSNPADWDIGQVRAIALMSPARQVDKARGLSGRQLVKWRKAQRRQKLA